MEIKIDGIGVINKDDGRDEYVLLTRLDDDLTPEQATDWLLPRVLHRSQAPGAYYCHTVRAVQAHHSANKVICTVEHRYDV